VSRVIFVCCVHVKTWTDTMTKVVNGLHKKLLLSNTSVNYVPRKPTCRYLRAYPRCINNAWMWILVVVTDNFGEGFIYISRYTLYYQIHQIFVRVQSILYGSDFYIHIYGNNILITTGASIPWRWDEQRWRYESGTRNNGKGHRSRRGLLYT